MGEDGVSILHRNEEDGERNDALFRVTVPLCTSQLFSVQFVYLGAQVSFKSPLYCIEYNDTTASILGSYSAIYIFIPL